VLQWVDHPGERDTPPKHTTIIPVLYELQAFGEMHLDGLITPPRSRPLPRRPER
jgi:hypothetical protein